MAAPLLISGVRLLAYVTYEHAFHTEDPDTDLPLFLEACAHRGVAVEAVSWDDPDVAWNCFDAAIVRSTWDYLEKFDQFQAWLTHVDAQTRLFNSRAMIEANLDKTYLRDLGVPIVPTTWVARADQLDLVDALDSKWIVVKPAVSAGARDTIRTDDRLVARTHARKIIDSGRIAMAQPYLDAVDGVGEISVICIQGTPRWAARKVPALTQGGHGGSKESVALTSELAEAALAALASQPESLYARVDLVPTPDGLLLMELELAEPSLFLPLGPENAADVLLDAVLTRLKD